MPLPLKDGSSTSGRMASWLGRFSLSEGLCVGIVLIICVNMPHSKGNDGLIWWWNMSEIPGGLLLQLFSLFAIAAGTGMLLVSLLTQDATRGMVYLLTGAAGVCLIAISLLGQPSGISLAVAVLPLSLLFPVMSISLFRRTCRPGGMPGRAVQAMLSAFLCAGAVAAAVLVVTAMARQRYDGSFPLWAVFTIGLSILGMLGAGACGICGLTASRSPFRPQLHIGTMITGIASLSALALAAAVFGGGMATQSNDIVGARFYLVQMLKLAVIACSLGGLLATGLFELLAGRDNSFGLCRQAPGNIKEQTE